MILTDKPTPQQVAWVFKMICENGKIAGSFRDLIYNKMEYSPYDYEMLYQAGGMAITNAMYNETWEQIKGGKDEL